jgi:hypothetical protein
MPSNTQQGKESAQPVITIDQFMNSQDNQKYNSITYYESEVHGLTHKELSISKFGAMYKSGLGHKQFFDPSTIFNIDELNRIVNLGTSTTPNKLTFKYEQIFYA